MASQQPDPVPTLTTSNSGTDIIVSWSIPVANFADISSYDLMIMNHNSAFTEATSYCHEDATTILASQTCTISLLTLRAAPFSLTYNQVVIAIVNSQNVYGASDYSQPNVLGATIKTEPH